jgi:iron complex outermembrane receptor protein
MGNIDSEGSKLRSYFVNDLNASYEIKPKSVFKVIVLSVLVNNILIINISQTDISILMTMITLIHQQLKRLKEQGIIPSGNQFLVGLTLSSSLEDRSDTKPESICFQAFLKLLLVTLFLIKHF